MNDKRINELAISCLAKHTTVHKSIVSARMIHIDLEAAKMDLSMYNIGVVTKEWMDRMVDEHFALIIAMHYGSSINLSPVVIDSVATNKSKRGNSRRSERRNPIERRSTSILPYENDRRSHSFKVRRILKDRRNA